MDIIFIVAVPFFLAFILSLMHVFKKIVFFENLLSILGLLIPFLILISTFPTISSGDTISYNIGGWSPFLGITLEIDSLSFFFSFISLALLILIMIYSLSRSSKYKVLYLLMAAGMQGVLLTRDIFNMYVFFEILSVSTYILVVSEEKRSYKASFKYLVLGSVASAFFLFGVGIVYETTGVLNMDIISSMNMPQLKITFLLFLTSLGIKSGIFPLHLWVPDAHSIAPPPVSALLSGLVLKIGIYSMLRLFYTVFKTNFFEMNDILMAVGAITVIFGAVLALAQKDLKRMMAYSSINQIGIIFLAFSFGTELGIIGALYMILAHAVAKACLFLCSGMVADLNILNLKSKPSVSLPFFIGSISLIGLPFTCGFIGKYFVCLAAIETSNTLYAGIILFASIISAVYYLRASYYLFRSPKDYKTPCLMQIPVYITSFACIILGVLPVLIMDIIELAAKTLGGII
jgi:multicomponent Na+:H+ antiporter subunit D